MNQNLPTYEATAEKKQLYAYGAILIIASTIIVYLPAITGGYIWDDAPYLLKNPLLDDLNGLYLIWFGKETPQYYPLVFTTFWVEKHLWGLNPFGFHLVNVIVHSLSALLVWRVSERLELKGAFIIAMIFALHPVHAESVAWVTERKNVLSFLFYLIALLSYLNFSDERGKSWYMVALASFILALFSKTVACSLPATIIIIEWYRGRGISVKSIGLLVPFFVVGAIMGLVTVRYEAVVVGAIGAEWIIEPYERLLVAGRALWFYAGKILIPAKLTFIYPRWALNSGSIFQWSFPASVVILSAVLFLKRGKLGKGPISAIAIFAVTLFPALGFFDVYPFRYSFVADHFQYHATTAMIALFTGIFISYGEKFAINRRAVNAIAAFLIIIVAFLTWRQAGVYKDIETLWRDTIEKNPSAWIAHNNLGVELAKQDRLEEAVASYRRALELRPDHESAHFNMANSLARLGKRDEALSEYRGSLRVNPLNATAAYNIASILAETGKVKEAKERFAQAIRINPSYGEAHNNLANLLFADGKLDEAEGHYKESARIDGRDPRPLNNLGIISSLRGDDSRALDYYKQAAKIAPAYAESYYNMGITLNDLGLTSEAKEAYLTATRLDPSHTGALNNLGGVYMKEGETDEAITSFNKALAIEPDNPAFKENLKQAKAKKGL